jgi:hypothetical protein
MISFLPVPSLWQYSEERFMRTVGTSFKLALGFATLAFVFSTILGAVSALRSVKAAEVEEKPEKIIAIQIRRQGYACGTPLSAEPDLKRSKPDKAAWVLKCDNATYRVRLIPDMAAEVEQLD